MTKKNITLRELRLNSKNPELRDTKRAASILKISSSMLYKVEQGHRMPSVNLIDRMSKEYSCSTDDIFLALNITKSDNKVSSA